MSGEKTEEPTDEKLRQSREKGQVPSRKNILEAILLLVGISTISGTYPFLFENLSGVFDVVLLAPTEDFGVATSRFYEASQGIVIYLIGFTGCLGFCTLFGNLLLNKFNFAPKAISLKFEKLNPVSGLKGVFSMTTVYNFIRMTSIFLVISLVTYNAIRGNMGDGVDASACGMNCLAAIFPSIIVQMITGILLVILLFALLDFRIQNILFRKQQKMSKDEVKKEAKNMEGDPHIKGARHEIGEEMIYMPSMKEVTHVVYSATALVAFLHVPNSAPFVVMKSTGSGVPALLNKFRSYGARCVNLPDIATQLHKAGKLGAYLEGKEAARQWFRILAASGSL